MTKDDAPSGMPDILSCDLENFPQIEKSPTKNVKDSLISQKINEMKQIDNLGPSHSESNLTSSKIAIENQKEGKVTPIRRGKFERN